MRQNLIEEAQAEFPNSRYCKSPLSLSLQQMIDAPVFPMAPGSGPHDEISFHIDYQGWGIEREHRPEILFQFDPPKPPPPVQKPGPMKFDGMIVLNHQNNPVLDWNIPKTLSSVTPGCFLEAWKRKFGGMSHQDREFALILGVCNLLTPVSASPHGSIYLGE